MKTTKPITTKPSPTKTNPPSPTKSNTIKSQQTTKATANLKTKPADNKQPISTTNNTNNFKKSNSKSTITPPSPNKRASITESPQKKEKDERNLKNFTISKDDLEIKQAKQIKFENDNLEIETIEVNINVPLLENKEYIILNKSIKSRLFLLENKRKDLFSEREYNQNEKKDIFLRSFLNTASNSSCRGNNLYHSGSNNYKTGVSIFSKYSQLLDERSLSKKDTIYCGAVRDRVNFENDFTYSYNITSLNSNTKEIKLKIEEESFLNNNRNYNKDHLSYLKSLKSYKSLGNDEISYITNPANNHIKVSNSLLNSINEKGKDGESDNKLLTIKKKYDYNKIFNIDKIRKTNESGSLKQKAFEINKKLNCNEVNFTFGNNKDTRRIMNLS